jgi:hypothetical protein
LNREIAKIIFKKKDLSRKRPFDIDSLVHSRFLFLKAIDMNFPHDPQQNSTQDSIIEPMESVDSSAEPAEPPEPLVPKAEPLKEKTPAFREFEEKLAGSITPEEKIAFGLSFMRSSISQEGTPRFREFWEARRVVLPQFKTNINPTVRSKLWGEYVELTVEARRLKEILEEQSAFAIEQIDLAIAALEGEISNFDTLVAQGNEIQFSEQSPTIQAKSVLYDQIQRELNLLNTLASRLNGLRKEVVKTDMRMRFKTKFFKRLSLIGDQIFPKRKLLIEQISAEFEKGVELFISRHFQEGQVVGAPYFSLREEIKALQGMAKIFTLSSAVFNRTRLKLSVCWDQIKGLEKEHKKEIHAKRQVFQESRDVIEKKIDELAAASATMELPALDSAIEEIVKEMREAPLARSDVFALKDKLTALRVPYLAAQQERARAFEEVEREKIRLKKEKISQIKDKMAHLLKEGLKLDPGALEEAYIAIKEEIKQLGATKTDQQQFDRVLRQLKDLTADVKAHALINLSEGDREALDNLRILLEQKKQRRHEIKEQVEQYRRTVGSSNLDFEKGMQIRELMDQEKELLEKTNASIEEIEQKIAELEG